MAKGRSPFYLDRTNISFAHWAVGLKESAVDKVAIKLNPHDYNAS